ncbi:acyltransferase family protein [Gordonia aurantiaca]|uniref:acyltransferase family protein n=1 Tax=Gordonia sp. B21 TaxID=3151852 RepID=UPI003267C709
MDCAFLGSALCSRCERWRSSTYDLRDAAQHSATHPFWYLWALPVYFIFTWFTVRVLSARARLWILLPLACVSAVSPWIGVLTESIMRDPLDPLKLGPAASNIVWFYLGACLPSLWFALMERARWSYLAASTFLYAGLVVPVLIWGVRDEAKVLLAPVALFISSQALALIRMQFMGMKVMQWVGRSTLPVYVLHLFAISVISAVVTKTGLGTRLTANGFVEFLVPPCMAVALTVTAIWVGRAILGSRYTVWLLEAPAVITRPRGQSVRPS